MSLKVMILIDCEEYLRLKKFVEELEVLNEPIQEQSIQGSKFLINYEVYEKLKALEKESTSQREN